MTERSTVLVVFAPEPYERLLCDAMHGDSSHFTREDSVEETWRIVQPLLDAPPRVQPYQPGSWGPLGADKLLAGHPGWREPWLGAGGSPH
jgi:glucose-6-phosphate 1-dehydrogenase